MRNCLQKWLKNQLHFWLTAITRDISLLYRIQMKFNIAKVFDFGAVNEFAIYFNFLFFVSAFSVMNLQNQWQQQRRLLGG